MENTFPQDPQPIEAKPAQNSYFLIIGLLLLLPLAVAGGYYLGQRSVNPVITPTINQNTLQDTQDNINPPVTDVTPSPFLENQVMCTMDAKICPDGSSVGRTGPNCEFAACPVQTTQSQPQTLKYTYQTFSFVYPQGWSVIDIQTNREAFKQNLLGVFQHEVLLEKNGELLFIGIEKHPSRHSSGGIFTSEQLKKEYLDNRDEVRIQGKTYYFQKTAFPLNLWIQPDKSGGITALASLSEFFPKKVTNAQGQVFDGYEDFLMNKNGYSYLFVKLTKNKDMDTPIDSVLQKEMIQILESITW